MKLAEKFLDDYKDESLEVECTPTDGMVTIIASEVGDHGLMTVFVKLNTASIGRLYGFLGLCLEAIRRMEELKEQQDG